jgi:hypothetical protein
MKIVVFGPFKRTGALHGESVVDLSRAYTKYLLHPLWLWLFRHDSPLLSPDVDIIASFHVPRAETAPVPHYIGAPAQTTPILPGKVELRRVLPGKHNGPRLAGT